MTSTTHRTLTESATAAFDVASAMFKLTLERIMATELRCNFCLEVFPEEDAVDDETCPYCLHDSLFEREIEEESDE
jgi:rRNA maturation endonuclease Nob1